MSATSPRALCELQRKTLLWLGLDFLKDSLMSLSFVLGTFSKFTSRDRPHKHEPMICQDDVDVCYEKSFFCSPEIKREMSSGT